MTNIIMVGGNPMIVEYFSFKTEFQDRGAGHIHGVLWVKLHKIEKLYRLPDKSLVLLSEDEKRESREKYTQPFKGIKSTFKKFRNGQDITDEEETSIINFVDQFTTVSLNPGEVRADLVEKVEKVNKHHHTTTCKSQPKCRFRYPKFPIWKTVLVKPYETEFPEEKAHYMKKYEGTEGQIFTDVKNSIQSKKLELIDLPSIESLSVPTGKRHLVLIIDNDDLSYGSKVMIVRDIEKFKRKLDD